MMPGDHRDRAVVALAVEVVQLDRRHEHEQRGDRDVELEGVHRVHAARVAESRAIHAHHRIPRARECGIVRADDGGSSSRRTAAARRSSWPGTQDRVQADDARAALTGALLAWPTGPRHTTTTATPDQVLEVLTHPDEIRRWSPIDFDVDDLDSGAPGARLPRTRDRQGGRGERRLRRRGPRRRRPGCSSCPPTVRSESTSATSSSPPTTGSEVCASVSLRRGGGITGRLVAKATAALLSAGVLEGAAGRIARAAELAA